MGDARWRHGRAAAVGVTVLVCGGATLAMELAASRVLAPRFGSGIQVWGALLGVVMGALAGGYLLGGHLGDRWPRAETLAATTLAGAALVALVPAVDAQAAAAAERVSDHPGWGAALCTIILFVPPTVLLAAAGPVAVRLRAAGADRSGRAAGDVLALSTVGSIVGSFAAAFWLIPDAGVSRTFLILALALALCGVALVAAARRPAAAAAALAGVAAVTALVLLPAGRGVSRDAPPARGGDVLFDRESAYHRVTVMRMGADRVLMFGPMWQSAWNPARPADHRFAYSRAFHVGLAQAARRDAVLHVGLGGATMPRSIAQVRPAVRQEAVELDPVVVDAARRWFGLDRIPGLEVHVDDGRRWLRRHPERRYDAILIDAYTSEGIPFHLFTREHAALLRDHLAPGGAVAVNLHGSAEGRASRLWRSVQRTFGAELPHTAVFLLPAADPGLVRNVILVASPTPIRPTAELVRRWDRWRAGRGVGIARWLGDRVEAPGAGALLFTDDLAPTDQVLDPELRTAALAQRPDGG